MDFKKLKEKLQDLYEENRVKELFVLLKKELSRESEYYSDFISIKRRYHDLQDRKMAETIDFDMATIETNKISDALLEFVNQLKNKDLEGNTFTHADVSNRILVLTTEAEMNDVKDFFNLLNFNNITVKPATAVFSTSKFDTFDLIIFDNRDLKPCFNVESLEKIKTEDRVRILDRVEKMEKIIKETTLFMIHYGEQLYWINSNRARVQAANSKFSLYARTREVIDFINTYRV